MNFQISLKQAGQPVSSALLSVSESSPLALTGELAPVGMPLRGPLILAKGSDFYLRVPAGVSLVLSKGTAKASLADLQAKGQVKKEADADIVKLPAGVSIELSKDDWSVIIEPQTRPATAAPVVPAARPPLRPNAGAVAAAGDLWAAYRIFSDTNRFTTFMKVAIVSLAAHLAIIIFFATRVIVHDPFEVVEIPERYAKFIAPPKEEPKPVQTAQTATKKVETKIEEATSEAPAPGEQTGGGDNKPAGPKSDAQRRAEIAAKVRNTGLLAIIGAKGSGGALRDVLSEGTLGGDLDKALENMKGSGLGVAATGEDLKAGGTRGGTGYGTADIGKLATGGPGRGVGLGTKAATEVKSDIATGEITASGSLDSSAIASVVKSKISGIKYCYEKELKNNPKLAGKVTVNFTIGETGEVTQYAIESSTLNNAEVEQCILRMIRRWKFPAPSGGTVNVSYPFIFTATG